MAKDIIYIRVSSLNTYSHCEAKFFYQNVEKIKVPGNIPAAVGTASHEALGTNFKQKVITLKDLKPEEFKDAFNDAFEAEMDEVDPDDKKLVDLGTLKDEGMNLMDFYSQKIAPSISPARVEQRIQTEFLDENEELWDYGLSGKVDVYDLFDNIIDHKVKTTAKAFNRTPGVDYDRQLGGGYALLLKSIGEEPKKALVDHLRYDRPEHRRYEIKIDTEHFVQLFMSMTRKIKNKIYYPNRDSFLCRKRYCKFWEACQHEFGGEVKP